MRTIFLTFGLILSTFLQAQTYHIERLTMQDGLTSNLIRSITQDKRGFLWFSTEAGLNKFDGHKVQVFTKHHPQTGSISGNELSTLYADKVDDIIWIATQREGLNAFDCKTETFKYYKSGHDNPQGTSTNDITCITNSANGNLWISTYHRGFNYFNKETETFTHYHKNTLPDLPSNRIWSIAEDSDRNLLYIGHVTDGLSVYNLNDKKIKNFKYNIQNARSIPDNEVHTIFVDKNKNVWLGTNNGLALFNPETELFTVFKHNPKNPHSLISNCIYSITQTADGKLWFGTEEGGISILNLQENMFLSSEKASFNNISQQYDNSGLSHKTVRSIFQDSFQNIWVGTYGGGVNFMGHTQSMFNTITHSPIPAISNKLSNPGASSICVDDDNRIWVGTDGGGINVFENGRKMALFNKEKGNIINNNLLSSFRDSNDNLWFGTFKGGINFYNKQTKSFRNIPLDEKNIDVRCFFEDTNHHIWVGTYKGIYVFNRAQKLLHKYSVQETKLRDDLVLSIFRDHNGNTWVGHLGEGISVYNSEMEEIHHLKISKGGLPSNTINHIYGDKRGNIWVGTGEGLLFFDSQKKVTDFKIYNEQNGMANSYIQAIIEDEQNNIWFSTNYGITCYNQELNKFSNYNHHDGIPIGNFIRGSVAKSPDGTLYFGSQNGVCFFNASKQPAKTKLPTVTITDFKLYNDIQYSDSQINIPLTPNITLNHKQNTFSVSFSLLDYSLKNSVEYAYMLQGLTNLWYNTNGENSVTFRNIPPGSYEILIKSRFRNQEWSDEITSLKIKIDPPVWLTWQAKVFYFLFIVLIIYSISRFYKRKLQLENSLILEKKDRQQEQELHNERLRFFTNITHELRTPLTLIIGPLEDLNNDNTLPEKQSRKIAVIYQSASRLLNLINQILEFRKTETQNTKLCVRKGDLSILVQETGIKYKELNSKKEVSFHVHIEEGTYMIYHDSNIVVTILENLLSNALKYTDRGEVSLLLHNLTVENIAYTEIEIKDTGRGIHNESLPKIFNRYYQEEKSFQASGTGIGLALVKNLVELHQGEISVESAPGKGSTFRFRLLSDNLYPETTHYEDESTPEELPTDQEMETSNQHEDNNQIILVVEDHEDICTYIKDSLSSSYQVYTAYNGREGLNKAFAYIPDIIISDVMMPEMDGFELTKILKEDIRTSHIPIILLTAKDTIQDRTQGYSLGVESYLAKPFSASLLHSRITNILMARQKIINLMNHKIENNTATLTDSLSQIDNEFIEKITSLIHEHIDSENLDVDFISEKLFMSHSTLYRKIKALTDMSPSRFIQKIRLNKAETLLLTGRHTISEVSYMTGFSSNVYFRQCFKKEYGISPSEFIRQTLEEEEEEN